MPLGELRKTAETGCYPPRRALDLLRRRSALGRTRRGGNRDCRRRCRPGRPARGLRHDPRMASEQLPQDRSIHPSLRCTARRPHSSKPTSAGIRPGKTRLMDEWCRAPWLAVGRSRFVGTGVFPHSARGNLQHRLCRGLWRPLSQCLRRGDCHFRGGQIKKSHARRNHEGCPRGLQLGP